MAKGKEAKPHIGIFGRRNNGKSSFINCIAKQEIAIVSDYAGTTTDPVKKSIEIHGIGPAILIDTAGIDDEGELGEKRIKKTLQIIKTIDLAILVIVNNQFDTFEKLLISKFQSFDVPYIVIHNKSDKVKIDIGLKTLLEETYKTSVINFSTVMPDKLAVVIKQLQKAIPETAYQIPTLVGDIVKYGDVVLLITPIDIEAPEGRMILPQVMTIRDVLDNDCVAIVLKEKEVDTFLKKNPIDIALAITDSQIFLKADASIPKQIPLTSFSVLLAKLKGPFERYIQGTPYIDKLKDNDTVLILESCTHHVSCDDIGRQKIPRWLTNYTGKKLNFEVVSGLNELPQEITYYAMVIQCGGCVITRKQIFNRLKPAIDANIPVTNYGMAIAYIHGIYNRAIKPFIKQDTIDYL